MPLARLSSMLKLLSGGQTDLASLSADVTANYDELLVTPAPASALLGVFDWVLQMNWVPATPVLLGAAP